MTDPTASHASKVANMGIISSAERRTRNTELMRCHSFRARFFTFDQPNEHLFQTPVLRANLLQPSSGRDPAAVDDDRRLADHFAFGQELRRPPARVLLPETASDL